MIDENKTTEDLRLKLSKLQESYEHLQQRYNEIVNESDTIKEDIRRSETRYHRLAEQVDAIVWRFDLKNDKWVYVSPQTERILGYLPEEWSDFQWWVDIMHPEDRAWAPSYCLTKTKQGTWHEFEYRLRHKNGKDIWIYDKVSVESVDGEPAFLYGVMFDITQRKHNEKIHQDYALRKLKTAIENTEASVVITDSEGSIEYANPFFTRVTGYTPDEYLGQTPRILKSGYQSSEFYDDLWQTITSGKTWTGEMCNKTKDGGYFWEFATISPVLNEADEITNFVGVKTDISPLKKLNEQLQVAKEEAEESKVRFEALHNATFGGIAIHDQGIILDCNKGLSDMTGYTHEELIGMDGLKLIAEESRKQVMANIQSGYDKPYEVLGLRKSGEQYSLRLDGRNMPYKGKEVRVVEFRDITIRKKNEQTIKKQNKELQVLNADKDRFISILAHDLKSPFGGLLGLSQLLAQNSHKYPTNKIVHFSNQINKTGQNIYNLLEDLLTWIRSQSGRTPFDPQNIGLKELCEEVTATLNPMARGKGIAMKCFVHADDV
ncbi:MAG: PAS domain S-box protein, partial [Marinilabilia sp.]